MREETLYVLALKAVPGIGDVNAKQLISYCGSAKSVFEKPRGQLEKIPNIGRSTVDAIRDSKTLLDAEERLALTEKNDIDVIPYFSRDYPEKLKLVHDSPLVLFYKGKRSYTARKTIGIVGTRKATSYGKDLTADIVKDLAAHQAVIVSGLAYGIDIAAHRAALKNNLPTVAVLAGGLDKVYPAAHKKTAIEIQEEGGLLTEQPLGTVPEAHYFPARNRIIAGMVDAVIVVEAAAKGGALITANIAHSYHREVFAIPGDLKNTYSEGCNNLIKTQKANIYTGVSDLEYLLNWEKGASNEEKRVVDASSFSSEEQKILALLADAREGLHLDELSWKSQIAVNQVVSLLLNLEFAGVVKSLPGKVYKII